jgi:hypothetical protein
VPWVNWWRQSIRNGSRNERAQTGEAARRAVPATLHALMIDDETTGLWAEKPARQARCREQLRSGDRPQGSCFFIHTEIACEMKVRHRSDEFCFSRAGGRSCARLQNGAGSP